MPIAITSFTAAAASINYGDKTTITPVFSGGTGVILIGEVDKNMSLRSIPILSGNVFPICPGKSMTYTLVVTSLDGMDTQKAAIDVTVIVPATRKLTITTGTGVIVDNTYYCNAPVYMILVTVDPASLYDHIGHTNEDSIKYQIIFNNYLGEQPVYIIGKTDLNSILAKFGLTWT